MTTPDHPDERADGAAPSEAEQSPPVPYSASYPISSSLSARLAELEGDDDPLFDDDDDEDGVDEGYDAAPPAPVSYHPYDDSAPVSYGSHDDGAPTSYDDSAFAAVGEPDPAPADEEQVTAEQVTAEQVTADEVTAALPAAPALIPAVPVDAPADTPVDTPAADADADGDGAAEAAAGRRRRARRRRVGLPVVALLLMTVLMAAATAFLWLQVLENQRTEDARREGLNASRDAARLLFSYDYRTLDKDFSTGRALTTGEFRTQYDKTTTKVVTDVAKQYKAVVKANVVSAGVVRATPDTVVTVVYVNQVTTSTRVTGQKVDLSRVRMTLREVGGRWLVEAVNAL